MLNELGDAATGRHRLQQVDLSDAAAVEAAVKEADPDLVMHLAAESHVDRSISGPGVFIESNVTGTYNLLQAVRGYFEGLRAERRDAFRMHHISTDEVFGSLDPRDVRNNALRPTWPYRQQSGKRSPVQAWHHTFGFRWC